MGVEHHHGAIGDPARPHGNGVLLWFEIDDFDAAVARPGELGEIVLAPHRNPPDGEPGGPAQQFPLYLVGRRMLESFPYIPLFARRPPAWTP